MPPRPAAREEDWTGYGMGVWWNVYIIVENVCMLCINK